MCRIFGTFGKGHIDAQQLATSSMLQQSGGPDEQSIIIKDGWALGANRLAIQDISVGSQPYSLDNKIYVIFNGEIYNHRELRKILLSKNYHLTSNCDGSVIPALYAEFGERFVEMLDGMFAIAIIDLRKSPKLLLACDHIGMKSLYYKIERDQVIFSSEVCGLWPLSSQRPEILYEKFDMYCSMQSIVGEDTIYKDVKVLKPGAAKCWTMEGNSTNFKFAGPSYSFGERQTYNESSELLRQLLSDEVSSMLSADVPVCLVTSGGLDSSYVSVLAAKKLAGIKAFNISYKGNWPNDERHFAIELAEKNNIDLEIIEADPNTFIESLPKMVQHLGQPNAAPHALSTYLLFKTINERGFKVAVTGEGADEQFGGYARFAEAVANPSNNWWEEYLDKLSAIPRLLREELYHDDFKHFLKTNPSGYGQVMEKIKSFQRPNRLSQLLQYDLFERFPYYILRRVDHLSMAHAVEVRIPFCQSRITQFAAQIPESWKIENKQVKRILYKASETVLPDSILNRPKQPFTLPIQAMLLPPHPLFHYFAETLLNGYLIKTGIIKREAVEKLIDNMKKNVNQKNAKALWTLGIFELWNKANQDLLRTHI